jgi:hypothetical protein
MNKHCKTVYSNAIKTEGKSVAIIGEKKAKVNGEMQVAGFTLVGADPRVALRSKLLGAGLRVIY